MDQNDSKALIFNENLEKKTTTRLRRAMFCGRSKFQREKVIQRHLAKEDTTTLSDCIGNRFRVLFSNVIKNKNDKKI